MRKPLEGIRVLDLTIWQQGTYATALMADLGADVVKVEERESGDPGRGVWISPALGLSAYFEAHNRGKRSIALNLKQRSGRDVFLKLAERADVFVNNFRINAIERLGLAYDDLSAVNPGIVYVQASGYGPAGDDASLGAFDFLAQARAGFASTNGEPDDPPLPTPVPIADQTGALHVCIAALAGLAARHATGRGGKYDTSLLGSMVALQSFDVTNYLFSGVQRDRPYRGGNRPFWRIYRAGDDKWFCIGMLLDRAWHDVCRVLGRLDLHEDPRFASYRGRTFENHAELSAILDEIFATSSAADWVERLNSVGMFAAPVQDYSELASDAQVNANGYIHEVPSSQHGSVRMAGAGIALDGEPIRIERAAPEHGEHTEEVLLEAGFTWDDIVRLRADDIVGPKKHQVE